MTMMNVTHLKRRGILAMFVLAAWGARAADDYLPFVGPPPLRFAMIPAPVEAPTNPVPSRPLISGAAEPTLQKQLNDTQPVASAASGTTTNAPSMTAADSVEKNPSVENRAGLLTPSLPLSAPDDLSNVSPGMLVNFFKPLGGRRDKGQAEVYVPVPMDFTPPVAPPVQSRATYKTE
jgi:hypothetical protein